MGRRGSRKKPKALAKAYCHKHVEIINEIVAPPIVTVEAELCYGDGETVFGASGGARCNRVDKFDRFRGHDIAKGRAATAIALQLVEAGEAPWKAT